MKIGFEAKRVFQNSRGLGSYARNLLFSLKNYGPKENQYFLFTPKVDGFFESQFNQKPFHIIGPKAPIDKIFPAYWRSFSCIKNIQLQGLDVFHGLSHEFPYGISKLSLKKVLTIHDLMPLIKPHFFSYIQRKIYIEKLNYAIKNADSIIAITKQVQEELKKFYPHQSAKVKVVYQSCDPNFITPSDDDLKLKIAQKYNLPQKYFLFVGAIEQKKNVIGLIEAFNRLSNLEVELILVGRSGNLLTQVEKLNHKRIRIIKNMANEDLKVVYSMARATILPSFYEGFGIPIIESLFCSTPVITTSGGCFAEAAGPGAIYINPEKSESITQAMELILTDNNKVNDLSVKGRSWVEQFSPEKTSQSILEIYQN